MSCGAGQVLAEAAEESGPGQSMCGRRARGGGGQFEEWNTAGVINTAHADAL